LIGGKGIRGLVIRNFTMHIGIKGVKSVTAQGQQKKIVFVEADSGVPINKLVRFTIDEGLAGLHMHLGLPGSVGGAVYMNSKWTHPDGYVGDAVYQVRLITADGQDEIKPQSYFHFAYDTSRIQTSKDVVISVVFALVADDKDSLWKIANESITYRRSTQPQGILSAGCTFRNLSHTEALTMSTPNLTTSAGYLVDHAGLKGASVGDAYISTQHANFIVNKGKATAADVVHLIEMAREAVQEKFGVTLKEEIERVGEF
jgi:UDP-N-acetylmuramate dehydrogenase